ELAQKLEVVLFVPTRVGLGARITRAAHAGGAAQGVHADPRVVGDRRHVEGPRPGQRLLPRVLLEGLAVLLDLREVSAHVRGPDDLHGQALGELSQLAQLLRVVGRDQDLPPSASLCTSRSRAIPESPRSMSASSWPREKGFFSAVPWTSMISP